MVNRNAWKFSVLQCLNVCYFPLLKAVTKKSWAAPELANQVGSLDHLIQYFPLTNKTNLGPKKGGEGAQVTERFDPDVLGPCGASLPELGGSSNPVQEHIPLRLQVREKPRGSRTASHTPHSPPPHKVSHPQ